MIAQGMPVIKTARALVVMQQAWSLRMATASNNGEVRVAVLVDCDNVSPEVLEHALKVAAQFGRIVVRRGYGNHGTLANKWQEALVRLAFTPCLQYQYASGKNTSDIALALDALEALFDHRADMFCLVTSDSDFAYLCRKLRERGAAVCIVGEPKTPDALRNASDQFFEWRRNEEPGKLESAVVKDQDAPAAGIDAHAGRRDVQEQPSKPVLRRPKFIIDAVSLLAAGTNEGRATLSGLGFYLKRTNPAFSPTEYGHSGLLDMLKTYDLLETHREPGGHWTVALAATDKIAPEAGSTAGK
jgi:uncharacterized protein (TIGR00288 family)